MSNHHLIDQSCQIGLAAFWQSVGIFANLAGKQTDNVRRLFPTQTPFNAPDATKAILKQAAQLAAGEAFTASLPAGTRQLTLLEQIRLDSKYPKLKDLQAVYPLQALCVNSLFPVKDKAPLKTKDYASLWEAFSKALSDIPEAHRANLPLWLDHFDTLWQVYTHAIPHITPDVSLYDHTHVTTALAVALWRYHQAIPASTLATETEEKFLLVQGDFFGIQDFIFTSGGETHKRATKLLRGRSFYVSLLMECAALRILDTLGLPSSSQVINAAGKFLIVAPNTRETIEHLQAIQQQFNEWFLTHTFGQSGIGLAGLPAKGSDFSYSNLRNLMKRLFEQLETVKLQRYQLCDADAPSVFTGFLDRFDNTKSVCAIDGRSPGKIKLEDKWISELAADQIKVGENLTKLKRLLLTRNDLDHNTLKLAIFGFYVNFTKREEITGKFGALARNGQLLRVLDFSLPDVADKPLWNGYARRAINAWIPKVTDQDLLEAQRDKCADIEDELELGEAKTLNHLACNDKQEDKHGKWMGISALMTLKGDVDDLGSIFQKGLDKPSFAKTAALSRQMNAFFSIWLPYLCQKEFSNIYTVFAGGDDFFLIGPWHSTIKLAQKMQTEFKRYVGNNDQVHFSAGLAMTKSGIPVNYLADIAEAALELAKKHNPEKKDPPPKNAVTCFNCSVSWEDFGKLLQGATQLNEMREDFDLSTSYLYGLLHLVKLREELDKDPANSIWQSRFQYRTWRMLETRRRDGRKLDETERRRLQNDLSLKIATQGIDTHKGNYRIALFTHLYQHRR